MTSYQVTMLQCEILLATSSAKSSFLILHHRLFSFCFLSSCFSGFLRVGQSPLFKGKNIQGWYWAKFKALKYQNNLAYLEEVEPESLLLPRFFLFLISPTPSEN